MADFALGGPWLGSDSLVLAALVIMLVMGTLASCGWDRLELQNREVWWWTCVLRHCERKAPRGVARRFVVAVVTAY